MITLENANKTIITVEPNKDSLSEFIVTFPGLNRSCGCAGGVNTLGHQNEGNNGNKKKCYFIDILR